VCDIDQLQSALQDFHRTIKLMVPQLGLGGLSPQSGARLVGRGSAGKLL